MLCLVKRPSQVQVSQAGKPIERARRQMLYVVIPERGNLDVEVRQRSHYPSHVRSYGKGPAVRLSVSVHQGRGGLIVVSSWLLLRDRFSMLVFDTQAELL